MGLRILTKNVKLLAMKSLLSLVKRKNVNKKRVSRGVGGVSMRGQLSKMLQMNQGVISMTGGR